MKLYMFNNIYKKRNLFSILNKNFFKVYLVNYLVFSN